MDEEETDVVHLIPFIIDRLFKIVYKVLIPEKYCDWLLQLSIEWKSNLQAAAIDLKIVFREQLGVSIIKRVFIGFLCNFGNQ